MSRVEAGCACDPPAPGGFTKMVARRDMKLTHFRDLLAVVQTGTLRAASRHLGIAQPVITRSIRELENELGNALFERHSKGVSLTPIGERFVRRIEGIQAEVRRAREEVTQWSGDHVGEIAVGLS